MVVKLLQGLHDIKRLFSKARFTKFQLQIASFMFNISYEIFPEKMCVIFTSIAFIKCHETSYKHRTTTVNLHHKFSQSYINYSLLNKSKFLNETRQEGEKERGRDRENKMQQQVRINCIKVHKIIFHSAVRQRKKLCCFCFFFVRFLFAFVRWMHPSIHIFCVSLHLSHQKKRRSSVKLARKRFKVTCAHEAMYKRREELWFNDECTHGYFICTYFLTCKTCWFLDAVPQNCDWCNQSRELLFF